jgi:hypothetical protein
VGVGDIAEDAEIDVLPAGEAEGVSEAEIVAEFEDEEVSVTDGVSVVDRTREDVQVPVFVTQREVVEDSDAVGEVVADGVEEYVIACVVVVMGSIVGEDVGDDVCDVECEVVPGVAVSVVVVERGCVAAKEWDGVVVRLADFV